MIQKEYGISVILGSVDFDETIVKVTEALKEQGFGVLTTIDVKATFKKKLDIDHPRYQILGACNPPFAQKVISADPDIGLLLPCNVVVREDPEDGIHVSFIDPLSIFKLVKQEELWDLAAEIRLKLKAAALAIQS